MLITGRLSVWEKCKAAFNATSYQKQLTVYVRDAFNFLGRGYIWGRLTEMGRLSNNVCFVYLASSSLTPIAVSKEFVGGWKVPNGRVKVQKIYEICYSKAVSARHTAYLYVEFNVRCIAYERCWSQTEAWIIKGTTDISLLAVYLQSWTRWTQVMQLELLRHLQHSQVGIQNTRVRCCIQRGQVIILLCAKEDLMSRSQSWKRHLLIQRACSRGSVRNVLHILTLSHHDC